MYDTSPLTPFKGETKPSFLHVELDNKTLESLFDLHPSLENSFDYSELVSESGGGGGAVVVSASQAHSPPGVPDSAVVTSPVASSADLLTLSSAATSQHLAEIERHMGTITTTTTTTSTTINNIINDNNNSRFIPQRTSPGPVVPSTPSPVSHHLPYHHHQQQQQQQHYQQSLSPSLTVDDVSQALSDDSCVFMPEYEQPGRGQSGAGASGWGPEGYGYSTVKTEDLGLNSLTACSLEASLPGFTSNPSSASSMAGCKMEYEAGPSYTDLSPTSTSPRTSMRTLSESSTATTSTMPDSPRRIGKGGSKRRQVPKGSEEYKEKRARNNVAVRKSRAKAKEKQKCTEGRVKELCDMNDTLTKKVEMLTKELTVLRGLFVNVGASLPDDFSSLLEQS
eukprot:GHVL01001343.1.p1 GENE.GHVL01001343.1~~GHVL01001343.1.p1  ORF type:complete len:394 (+),score=35.58 GHVL01001343.1:256-1437(+)